MHFFHSHSFKASLFVLLAGAGMAQSTWSAETAGAPVALDRAPQSTAMADSVVTVDSLVLMENRLARARAEEQAVQAGLAAPPVARASKSSGPVAPRMTVLSIYGIGDNLRANFTLDADLYENVRAGARVGACKVLAIDERTVRLTSAGKKGGASVLCPTGRWTGLPTMLRATKDEVSDAPPRAVLPSPAVPTPFSSVGQPTVSLQPRPGQLMLPAAPLIPRQTEPTMDGRLDRPSEVN